MDLRQLKKDVQCRTVTLEGLFEVIERMDRRTRRLEADNARLRGRLGKYEPEILKQASDGEEPAADATDAMHYSLEAEERRRGKRRAKPIRQGRVSTRQKLKTAVRIEDLFPEGAQRADCTAGPVRVVWRIENGQAERVGYRPHRDPEGRLAEVADVLPQGEFDLQIVVALAYLTYLMRLSLDQACELFQFFWKLPLTKSQADALLNQLARRWEPEFERICELLALAIVVGTDETGWKEGKASSNAAVFASPEHTALLFGCPKGRETLEKILPKGIFRGVLVSDDHSTYQGMTRMQKCWAHLLRKAIRLKVLYPEQAIYSQFLEELLAIYREANHRRMDQRLGEAGRRRLAGKLQERVQNLCYPSCWGRTQLARTAHAKDHELLANEIYRLAEFDELFTFVIYPEVPGTNNESEQRLRGAAQCRKLNRTSKTSKGAHRRSVITTVLESLRKNLGGLSLASVTAAVKQWLATGRSVFARQLAKARRFRQAGLSPG